MAQANGSQGAWFRLTRGAGLTLALCVTVVSSLAPRAAASIRVTELWVDRYNGPASGNDIASSVATSPDGSRVFVTGSSDGARSSDYATIAYDPSTGTRLWTKRFRGPEHSIDDAGEIAVSTDGSRVFVAGRSIGATGTGDIVTVSYDASTGDQLWVARYNGPRNDDDVGGSISVSPNGSALFVAGASIGSRGRYDFVTVAYDVTTGAQSWARRYDGPGRGLDVPRDIATTPDGSTVVITGVSDGGPVTHLDYATLGYDASSGTRLWARRYKGPDAGDDDPVSVVPGSDGSTAFVTGASSGDFATIAYDVSTGAPIWVNRYNSHGRRSDYAYGLAASPDGSRVFVAGESLGNMTGDDFATVAYDATNGDQVWVNRYNGPGNSRDGAYEVATNPDGSKLYVTGESTGRTGDTDYATIAYAAQTGTRLWVRRYDGSPNGYDIPRSLTVNPDGSKVFVTGYTEGEAKTHADYATVAYTE